MLDKHALDIPCPSCGHKTPKTIGWVKANDHFPCDGCGREITLDRDQFVADIKKAEKALAGFRRKISKR